MLALYLMLSGTYYAQNYASIIGWCIHKSLSDFIQFTSLAQMVYGIK